MPAQGSDAPNVRDELARIRAEVERGTTDLAGLGFWSLVERVKRDPALLEQHAEEIGAIDGAAFERRFKIRPPVWLGNLILAVGAAAMVALVVIAVALATPDAQWLIVEGSISQTTLLGVHPVSAGLLLLAAGGGLSVVVHDLAHWAAGRLGGIRFSSYFLDGPFRIQPGIKTDYASYLRATPAARARMHAAGAVASKIAPFAVFFAAYIPHATYDVVPYELFPEWALWGVLAIGVVQLLTDVIWSTKKSDWKKYAREKRVARDLYSRGRPGSSDAPG